ncbi:hypothetical protein [Lawsonibacter sp. JLR.KK007]|uniref:hypothetical protein n=1 Tax=Lawsonibacter sp. JLR.KK007 TaxID=3114293 RepID=UPI002FF1C1AC
MKKITVLLLALSLALALCACSSSNKIPSLEEIVENGAEWGGEQIQQVQGCTLADLEKAWGEADGELPGEYAYFWKVDDTTSVNVYYHKNAEIERITVTSADDEQQTAPVAPDPQPAQMSLAQVDGSAFDLSKENAKTIQQILDAGSWVSDATDCASDCVLTFDGRTIYYHSECGTFNERLEQSNQSLRLSDADRETVNAIIQTVIPHDLSPVEILPFSYEEVLQMWGKSDPGVKTDGFQNTSGAVIATPQQVIERAQNECTIEYDTTSLAYDNAADIWRVTFYTEGSVGNSQDVYLNGSGLTALIIYGE